MKVTILEMPQGGYCLRMSSDSDVLHTAGSYPTAEDAARIARMNGYETRIEASTDILQMEFGFEEAKNLALTA